MVNFYAELALDRDASAAEIRARLQRAKLEYRAKAMRGSGSMLSEFKRKLELADQAEDVFKDDDARDRYDVALRRADAPDVQPTTDWVGKAWTYYANGDNGAALIAARKAKEQAPDNPMAYVVSAEVWLKDGEPKQAKRDADEAFVLGENSEDEVDVLEIRAKVFEAFEEYGRAVASLASAIKLANNGAKPELCSHKAEIHLKMGQPAKAYESASEGLSQHVEISDDLKRKLEGTAMRAINQDVTSGSPTTHIDRYSRYLNELAFVRMDQSSKIRIMEDIRKSIERCQQRIVQSAARRQQRSALHEKRDRLTSIAPPSGRLPAAPWDAVKVAAAFAVIGIVLWQFSRGLGGVGFLAAAGSLAYAGVIWARRSEWTAARERYEAAQKALEGIDRELRILERP